MAAIVEARRIDGHNRHLDAFAKGKAKIALEGKHADAFREKWLEINKLKREGETRPAPQRQHTFSHEAHYERVNDGRPKYKQKSLYKPISRKNSIKLAGKHGYIIARSGNRKKPPPNSITVELSVYALLHMAYLSKSKSARVRVEAALDRLCRFVGKMPGVLHSWERTETNALRLKVNGAWLEHPYAPVPLPLPIRSSTALALLLFLANHATLYRFGVSQEKLCSILGVSGRHTAHRENILFKALVVIENLLNQLPSSALKSAKFPGCFEVKELDGGKMMFMRIPRREEPEIALGSDEAEDEVAEHVEAKNAEKRH